MEHIFQSLLLFLLHLSSATLVIPLPNGKYGIGTTEMVMTDNSRLDPLAPKPINRSVVVSAFYPVAVRSECDLEQVPYMPPKVAAFADQDVADLGVPKGTFELFRLQQCSPRRPRHSRATLGRQEFPLVLFSPASGASRLYYSAMAQAVASHGFTIVTIDHPYDAHIVAFPDGRVVKSSIDQPEDRLAQKLLEIRAKDVSFVIDELAKAEVIRQLLPHLHPQCQPDTERVAMYGHSAGGGTALLSMINETRIIGGLNLDGGLGKAEVALVVEHGITSPFLFFHGAEWSSHRWGSRPWKHAWPHLDWKLWLHLKNSAHGTFTDVPLLAKLAGLNAEQVPGAAKRIGTLPGDRAMDIITTYVVAFMDFVFTDKPQDLLQEPSKAFPEVSIVRR